MTIMDVPEFQTGMEYWAQYGGIEFAVRVIAYREAAKPGFLAYISGFEVDCVREYTSSMSMLINFIQNSYLDLDDHILRRLLFFLLVKHYREQSMASLLKFMVSRYTGIPYEHL